jgi:hypothetical protein
VALGLVEFAGAVADDAEIGVRRHVLRIELESASEQRAGCALVASLKSDHGLLDNFRGRRRVVRAACGTPLLLPPGLRARFRQRAAGTERRGEDASRNARQKISQIKT